MYHFLKSIHEQKSLPKYWTTPFILNYPSQGTSSPPGSNTVKTLPHIPMTIWIYTMVDLHYAWSVWVFIVQHRPFKSNFPNWTTGALLVRSKLRTLGRFPLASIMIVLIFMKHRTPKSFPHIPNSGEVKWQKWSWRADGWWWWQAEIWELTVRHWIYFQTHRKYDSWAIQLTQRASRRS